MNKMKIIKLIKLCFKLLWTIAEHLKVNKTFLDKSLEEYNSLFEE